MTLFNMINLLVAFFLGACGAGLIYGMGFRLGLVDIPNHRSSHQHPKVKGGGVGILAALIFFSMAYPLNSKFWIPVVLISLLGLAGDKWNLSPLLRMGIQFSLAFIFFASVDHYDFTLSSYLLVALLGSLFITASANFYNFMDGIDGIAGFSGIIAFGFFFWYIRSTGADSHLLWLSGGVIFACLGFLPWNFPRARIFMGDVGSLPLGFLFGGYVCYFSTSLLDFIVFSSFLFPFYADSLSTLAIRIVDRENIFESHRRHLYQLLVNELAVPHWKVALLYAFIQLVVGLSMLTAKNSGSVLAISLICLFFFLFFVVSRNLRKKIEERDIVPQTLRQQLFSNNLLVVFTVDMILIILALLFACILRFDNEIPSFITVNLKNILPLFVIIKFIVFSYFDLYRGMWRYTSLPDIFNVIKASLVSFLIIVSTILFVHGFNGFPRSVFVVDCVMTIIMASIFRLGVRFYYENLNANLSFEDFSYSKILERFFPGNQNYKRLIIVGAGGCGEQIVREIHKNPAVKYKIVGFVDDDFLKIGKKIHGVPVLNSIDRLESVAQRVGAEEILIAAPSASAGSIKRIVGICEKSGLPFKTIPNMGELINGTVSVGAIREVSFRDLLGRPPVSLDQQMVGTCLDNQRILVTGAGGSIGSELCRQICRFKPAHVVVLDWAETPLFEIDYELKRHFPFIKTTPLLVDIQDKVQVERVFKTFNPDVVFHAAAYKHLAMLEGQPWKAVMNNILGTVVVAEAAKRFEAKRFVYVSTDKAVMPTSIMGASKRIAEMFIQNQNSCFRDTHTHFMTVRFGNVAGSAGSVVPIFKKQIREGGPVTVTHPEVTRFFMTIPEACQLILQACAMGQGREIFLLDMGTPIKILDMAKDLIRLYGLEPEKDIMIEIIGLRKGEKLFEELVAKGEDLIPTSHKSIMVLAGKKCSLETLSYHLETLMRHAVRHDEKAIVQEFQALISDYTPSSVQDSFYPPN